MKVTEVRIQNIHNPATGLLAQVQVVLNDGIVLRGIELKQGTYGHYISFPRVSAKSPHRVFEPLNHRMRMEIQQKIFRIYESFGKNRTFQHSFIGMKPASYSDKTKKGVLLAKSAL